MSPTYHQQPTLQNARIRTSQDALQVFFAVARNVLTLLTRRLDADERKAIRSGNVYIWEDRSASTVDNGGLTMERWYAPFLPSLCAMTSCVFPPPSTTRTDGMSWGPSRIREVGILFLSLDLFNQLKWLHLLFVATQEFLFYYQRDPAQERLPSGGG
jgi:hypothetical protein